MSLLGLGTDHLCGGEWASCALPIRQYELQPLNDQYNQLCVSSTSASLVVGEGIEQRFLISCARVQTFAAEEPTE